MKKSSFGITVMLCSIVILNAENTQLSKISDEDTLEKQTILIECWSREKVWVVDREQNLMWQDNNEVANLEHTWQSAVEYCHNLSLGGYTDWKLPNYEELLSIVDYKRYDPAIVKTFTYVNTSNNYWTETKHIEQLSSAWIVYFYNGYTYIDDMKTENYVRCVRHTKGI